MKDWTKEYFENEDGFYRYINRTNNSMSMSNISKYEIVFDCEKNRYYCFVDAINIEEALGIFFINHDTVTYSNIVDTMEV